MEFQPASPLSVASFVALCAAIVVAFLFGIRASEKRDRIATGRRVIPVAIALTAWLAASALLVHSGFVAARPSPRLMFFGGGIMLVTLVAALATPGRWLATSIPIGVLVGFQAFRLPLELILHAWADQGTIPGTMTWTGQNWDIVTGGVSLAAAAFAGNSRAIAWAANGIGLALLLNVFRVVIFSSPLPFAWPVSPPLVLAFHLPYALIVPVCVGGALFGHVVLTRALLQSPAHATR